MEIRAVVNHAAILEAARGPGVRAAMDRVTGKITNNMKRLAPVSPVVPASGKVTAGGRRGAGDYPLRPSGYLRTSCHAFRLPDGSVIIGPTADYGGFVNDGTPPHVIRSTGPWPLRNRATGQVFGQVVNHPGTQATHFITRAVLGLEGEVFRG